jgi:squalene-hopene/tetraprenyl-beta-curcumene cyclase
METIDPPEVAQLPTIDLAAVRTAIERGQRVLRHSQRDDGSWESPGDLGPVSTAQVLVALHHLGRLSPRDAAEGARWLRAQQCDDGSFVLYPSAAGGDPGATACTWAALHVTAQPENAPAIARARAWLEQHGGTRRVVAAIAEGDLSAVFLALAGLLDAHALPCPSMLFSLLPPVVDFLQKRFHSGILMVALQLGVLVRRLRGDWGPDGTRKSLLARAECDRCIALLDTFQNQDGSWNANTVQAALALPALRAAGLTLDDPRVARGLAWLEGQAVRDERGLHFDAFGSAVWSTAFDLRALFATGVRPADPDVGRALTWLVESQLEIPQPAVDNRQPGVPRTGGWAFQRGNHTMADSDDAGVVLATLGTALAHRGEGALDPQLEARVRRAVNRGRAWLLGMQNPDGGWSAFVWGLPGKPPGPMMERPVAVPMDDPWAMAKLVVDPQPALGDPSTEDITARVLHGLALIGEPRHSEAVRRGVAFLRAQQCDSGAWWGRWVMNYLAATAFVLIALEAVGEDLRAHWIRRAVRWVLAHQNPDGGWGELPVSYRDPRRAGEGPSMPPLTGLVVTALVAAGEGGSPAVARAVAYLLAQQRDDGTWPDGDYLAPNVPPDTFYAYREAARFYPLEALGRYLALRDGESPAC